MRSLLKLSAFRNVKLAVLLLAGVMLPVMGLTSLQARAQAAAAPKFVQEKDKLATGKTVAQSFTSATTAGNLLVVYVIWDNTGTAVVTDSRGDAFASAGAATTFNSKYNAQVFYAKNIVGGADTVTATFATATKSFGILYLHEYSGADKTNPLDGSVAAKGGTAAMSSGNLTTTSANDLLFGGAASAGAVSAAGSGYVARSTYEGNLTEDKSAGAAGVYSATATQSGSWAIQLVAFKPASGPADTTPPSVPTGLTATAVSTSQINLSWGASTDDTGVTSYNVYRGGVQVAKVTGTSYSDTGLAAGTNYSYTVSAVDAAGNTSAQSVAASATTAAPDSTPPSVPTALTATPVSVSQINLSWTAATDNVGVVGYVVYRDGAQIAKVTGATYQDAGLVAGTTYAYTVSALDAAGNVSAQSAAVSANTLTPLPDTTPPTTPTGVTATAASATQINLSWTAATDDTGVAAYQISRDGAAVATVTGTSYSDTAVVASTTYSYAVTASDAAGNVSPASAPATVTTPAAPVQGACPLPAYPNPSCTGRPASLGTFANVVTGDYIVTTPGTIIDNWHITGSLEVNASNVTIKNSQIDSFVDNENGSNHYGPFTITDSTVGPASGCNTSNMPGIGDSNYAATRVLVRGSSDGFHMGQSNVSITDSYMHLCWLNKSIAPPDGSHNDGLQNYCTAGECDNLVFSHNTVDGHDLVGTDNLGNSISGDHGIYLGGVPDGTIGGSVTVTNNLFDTTSDYTLFLRWQTGPTWTIQNNQVVNQTWVWAPVDAENTCAHQSWSGNAIVTIDASFNITSTVAPLGCLD